MSDDLTYAIAAAMRLNARRWDDPIPTVVEAERISSRLQELRRKASP